MLRKILPGSPGGGWRCLNCAVAQIRRTGVICSQAGRRSVKKSSGTMGLWIAIGVGIGAAIGVAVNDIGLWIPLGIAVGAGAGAGRSQKNRVRRRMSRIRMNVQNLDKEIVPVP
jgi:hypothetical protein